MTAQRALLLVCLVFALREPLLWGLTPPLHAPDEAAHFDVVERLEQTHTLPVLNPECVRGDYYSKDARTLLGALVNPVVFHPSVPLPPLSDLKLSETPAARSASGCNYVAIYPPVYYAPAALADTLATHATFPQRLAAVRASGLVWGLLAVACAFLCGLLWLGDARGGLLVGLVVALQPMAGFLFASVSNDGPVIACGCAAAASLAWALRDRGLRPWFALAAVCVLGVLSKPSFTLLLPGVACAALLAADPRTRSAWLRVAATLTPATLAHLAWMHHLGPAVGSRLGSTVRALPLGTYLRTHLFVSERWLNLFGTQLWLAWGWVDVVLRPGWYWLLWLFFAAALVGLALGLRTFTRRDRLLVLAISLALGAQVAALLALEWLLLRGGEGELLQGRYFLPLFVALTLVLFLGLTSLGDRLRLRIDLRALFLLALTVFGAVASLRCATRYAGTGRSALAHAHAVYDLMLPGLFWPALALHLAALALALWLAAKALPIARKA